MLEMAFAQGFFKIALALLGIILGRCTLMWFDYFLGESKFTRWLENATDIAKSIYYSGRFIGVSIVIGLAIG